MAILKFASWAIQNIADIGNGDPNKTDPGDPKIAAGFEIEKPKVQTMNWILGQLGLYSKANNQRAIQASGYVASPGQDIAVDNSAGAVTGSLPTDPLDGQWVIFAALEGSPFSDNAVTVSGNGNDIMEVGVTDINLDIDSGVYRFTWNDTDTLWKLSYTETIGEV